jgi:hypothetical protein
MIRSLIMVTSTILSGYILFTLLAFCAMDARSDTLLDDFWLETGATYSIYLDHDAGLSKFVRLGHDDFPIYAVGSREDPEIKMLGQPLSNSTLDSFGLGVRHGRGPLRMFFEFGVTLPEVSARQHIQDEVVYTQLVTSHGADRDNRPIPIYEFPRYVTSYELDNGYFARVGFRYMVTDHIGITAAYRALTLKEEYTLKGLPNDWALGRGGQSGAPGFRLPETPDEYWREDVSRDMGSFEFGIHLKF